MKNNSRNNNGNSKPRSGIGFSVKDIFKEKSNIELIGNNTAIIEGSKGVLEYSDVLIRIGVDFSSVVFSGRGLTLKCISPTSLIIEGFITNIEFCV